MTPEPYRSPLGWNQPTVISHSADPEVHVSIPNEDPATEDDLTIQAKFTGEGIIVDLYVSDGEPVATFAQTYEEFVGTIYDLDPAMRPPVNPTLVGPVDSPIQRVAALSADLRMLVESDDDYVDDAQTMMCATDLLDAIDAMLSEVGR